jgi:hypothetical protein
VSEIAHVFVHGGGEFVKDAVLLNDLKEYTREHHAGVPHRGGLDYFKRALGSSSMTGFVHVKQELDYRLRDAAWEHDHERFKALYAEMNKAWIGQCISEYAHGRFWDHTYLLRTLVEDVGLDGEIVGNMGKVPHTEVVYAYELVGKLLALLDAERPAYEASPR